MNSHTVKVFRLDLPIDQRIQFVDSQTNSVELFSAIVEMRTDVFVQENLTSLFVRVKSADAQKQSEVFSEILKELGLVVEPEGASGFEQDLNFVTTIGVLVVAFHEPGVDFPV